jgi:hypothetical protein
MLLLTSTSDLIRVITDAAADIEVHASWVDHSAGVITPGRTNTASITTATTTTVLGSPAASTQRNLKHLSLTNNHASVSSNVAVEHTDGTTPVEIRAVNLAPGENLTLDDSGNWRHYDANGGEYAAVGPIATQAEMEGAASILTVVTPGRQHFHPSAAKWWIKAPGAGTSINASYNVTSVTDVAVGRLGVNIATDHSDAEYCVVMCVQRALTALAEAGVEAFAVRNLGQLAGSVELECFDHTATTMVTQDPQSYYAVGYGDI